jgi:hypothetical protein
MKKMQKQLFTTLKESIEWVSENQKDGCICPCCEQISKIYKRRLNSGMAYELIALYKISIFGEYVHHSRFSETTGGEISKLRYWGLVIEKPKSDDKNTRTSGFWAITEKGIDFVLNKIKVSRHLFLYDAKFLGFSKEETNIIESLGKSFNYEELMRGY